MPPHADLRWLPIALACALAGCASKPTDTDNEPTLATLAGRSARVEPERRVLAQPDQAIAAYRQFLAQGGDQPQRSEAQRRLADLEMDRADETTAGSGNPPDYRAAIAGYTAFLRSHPQDPGNDRVLYQLARAQEQGGDLPAALLTLDRLVATYPATPTLAEAQFRRGELLFTQRRHADAELAFGVVLLARPESLFHERALYMQGWSRFKQGRLEDALHNFFGVLDRKLGASEPGTLPALSRADRELVEDSFRVTSLSLQALRGADSIPAYITSPARETYEAEVHTELAALYLKQERVKDAADALAAFARRRPLHAQAPVLLSRVIGIHEQAGFTTLALQAKEDFVTRYGAASEFRRANPEGWQQAQPLVKTHLAALARHHHALAQRTHQAADVQQAVVWYRAWLAAFPDAPEAADSRFLLAELLFEDGQFSDAATEYEQVAYDAPSNPRAADAGYAVLLAQARLEDAAADKAALQRQGVARSLRFAKAFPADPRTGAVLTHAADQLFALKDSPAALEVARQVLALQPPATGEQRRVAWTVVAHAAFDSGSFNDAELAWREVLALTPPAGQPAISERLALAVFRQGEAARGAGDLRHAVGHFERIAALAPDSSVRASAQVDAAAALITLQDWPAAVRLLEDFRQRFPQHALTAELPAKLATAYLAQQQWGAAAAEFDRLALSLPDPEARRGALWQAAELRTQAGQRTLAQQAWQRYVTLHPAPLEPAVQARQTLATLAHDSGDTRMEAAWLRAVQQADLGGGGTRTPATRTLGAMATLALAAPVLESYRQVRLVEPLQKQLALKKTRLEAALQALTQVADAGVPVAVTAAAFHSAQLYQDFGRALMTSERPKKLKAAALEQYNVMLEEQAFPFEEKAIALHETNARRAADGVYDDWVKKSFAELASLRPARYAKLERGSGNAPAPVAPTDADGWNALGIQHRQQGRFADAKAAYEQALALQPGHADALLNQAILHDLYLGDRAQALALYTRWLAQRPAGDATVARWLADLKNRKDTA